ncbi:MAG: hypothetical protein CYPHOPRED_001867 [Cyphobasidiales sp. Tagirdzhanova-0007]|nr:MAG: hypothetical protein CYPHOPRED_001867 [Cyphobasidiales sp. Tagirdzhanova-0007]
MIEAEHHTDGLVCECVGGDLVKAPIIFEALRPDEVLIDIKASGICHTDIALQHGNIPYSFPCVLGHEGAGVVVRTGSAVTSLIMGDKVLIAGAACHGSTTARTADGVRLKASLFGGSTFARQTVALAASCIKVAKSSDLTVLAPLGCGIMSGSMTVFNILKPKLGSSMAIYGLGAVGCAALMAANLRGLGNLIAIDVSQSRLDLARELGATHTVNPATEDVTKRILNITAGLGVDNVVEATGVIRVLEDAFQSVAIRGTVATVGAPPVGAKVQLDVFSILIKGITYVGSCAGDAEARTSIPALISLYDQGRFPLDRIVERFHFSNAALAVKAMKSGSCVKPVLTWEEPGVDGSNGVEH